MEVTFGVAINERLTEVTFKSNYAQLWNCENKQAEIAKCC